MGFFSDLADRIIRAVKALGDLIKWIWLRIVKFFENIRDFFNKRERLAKLRKNRKLIALSIKQNLANGNYRVVNCLYDEEKDDLSEPEEDTQVITTEELDKETEKQFGNYDMIILKE